MESLFSHTPRECRSTAAATGTASIRYEKLLGINTWVDRVLEKIFRMPAFVPSDYEGRMKAMEKMSNLTGLIIWVSVILSCMSSGMAVDGIMSPAFETGQ